MKTISLLRFIQTTFEPCDLPDAQEAVAIGVMIYVMFFGLQ